jgi:hypothetical protein
MKTDNAKNSHKHARKQQRTGKYKKYIQTHQNILHKQLSKTNILVYITGTRKTEGRTSMNA